jgi:hypothetical protein
MSGQFINPVVGRDGCRPARRLVCLNRVLASQVSVQRGSNQHFRSFHHRKSIHSDLRLMAHFNPLPFTFDILGHRRH